MTSQWEICSGSVIKVPLTGGAATTLASVNNADPWGIVVDATSVYWVNDEASVPGSNSSEHGKGSVMKVPLGGGTPTTLASGLTFPAGIAVDATNVYWTTAGDSIETASHIMKAPLSGGTATTLVSGLNMTNLYTSIAVDATNVYWTNPNGASVMKVSLDGGAPITLASSQNNPASITVNATGVYWTSYVSNVSNTGSIMKVPLDGGTPTALASGQRFDETIFMRIAVDVSNVYWMNCGYDHNAALMKVPLSGGTLTTLASGQDDVEGMAVDASSVYWVTNSALMELTPK
jgi:hypothetical protein